MCVPVRSFFCRHVYLDPDVRAHCGTEKTLLYIIIVIFAENASFKSYGIICLPRMPLTSYSGATKYGYKRNPRNVGMTLLFAVLTKNDSFRNYSTFVYLLRAHILNINTCTYTTSAHGNELSGCVRADAYNLILIFASYYYAPWPCPCIYILRMIREIQVIMKAALHFRLAV